MTLNAKTASLPRPAFTRTGPLGRLVQVALTWQVRARARRDLRRLDAHLLRDIGLDPLSARHETAKSFWQD